MTLLEIMMEVRDIRLMIEEKGDNETAHQFEKKLWHDFIKSIAEDKTNPKCREAQEVLETAKIKFTRWFA